MNEALRNGGKPATVGRSKICCRPMVRPSRLAISRCSETRVKDVAPSSNSDRLGSTVGSFSMPATKSPISRVSRSETAAVSASGRAAGGTSARRSTLPLADSGMRSIALIVVGTM